MNIIYKSIIAINLLCMASVASANMIDGLVTITGDGQLNIATPNATTLTMDGAGFVAPSPSQLTKDFATYLSASQAITFSTTAIDFTAPFAPIADFWSDGYVLGTTTGFRFELTNLFESAAQSTSGISLSGSGFLTGYSFDKTAAQITIGSSGVPGTLAVYLTTTTSVPEPLILGLLGLGLAGIGARRRFHKSA